MQLNLSVFQEIPFRQTVGCAAPTPTSSAGPRSPTLASCRSAPLFDSEVPAKWLSLAAGSQNHLFLFWHHVDSFNHHHLLIMH